jgi:flagella basal body P-ring formation protein FlgA
MMRIASALLATALLAATTATAFAQVRDQIRDDGITTPVLRANVAVAGDVVRIGDVIDNAGASAKIAIYRAPDFGTTGSLPTAQVLAALRAHQVIGVDTRDISEITVTRLARIIEVKDIKFEIARTLEHRNGFGDAANLSITFDRDVQDLRLDASNTGTIQTTLQRYEPRNNRFDVSIEIANDVTSRPTRLHFSGTAIETAESAVLTRDVERGDVLRPGDVVLERRPKADIGSGDLASIDHVIKMQMRKQLRAGQVLKVADIGKPDLVLRDQDVTLTFQTAGLYLTVRGKALDAGAEGDVVNVINLQSKRTVSGVVIGRGQVGIAVASPRPDFTADASAATDSDETTGSIAVTANTKSSAAPRIE